VKFPLLILLALLCGNGCSRPKNQFSFCRDFSTSGCVGPFADRATYNLSKTVQNKTLREFYNSLYFRGDRLAFALQNADARKAVDFECLHGRYSFGEAAAERHELEYIELREKNVFGLVMLGSMIEKLVTPMQHQRYKAIAPFRVTYEVFCGKDLLAKQSILVALE